MKSLYTELLYLEYEKSCIVLDDFLLISPVINAGMVSGAAPALAPALSWIGKALVAGAGYVVEEHLDYREENKNYIVILESGVYDGIEFSEPHYIMVGDENDSAWKQP